MNWLDTHAPGVQAFAAIASLVAAVVLAFLTANYVRLTRDIAKATADQIALSRETIASSHRLQAAALAALAERLREPLEGLHLNHYELSKYSQLHNIDIERLETLALILDAEATTIASRAAVPLRTIRGLIDFACQYTISQGWIPPDRDQRSWQAAHPVALAELQRLIDHCREVAG